MTVTPSNSDLNPCPPLQLGRPTPTVKPTFFPLVVLCAGLLVIAATSLAVNADSVQPQTSLNLVSGAPTASRCSIQRHATLLEAFHASRRKFCTATSPRTSCRSMWAARSRRSQDERCTEFLGLLVRLSCTLFTFLSASPTPRQSLAPYSVPPSPLSYPRALDKPLACELVRLAFRTCRRFAYRLRHRLRLSHPVYTAQPRRAQEAVCRLAEANNKCPSSSSHEYSVVPFADADTEEIFVAYTYPVEKTATQE
ncbi:hypothetical protein K438DRAFT_1962190 [Mycena galopus ATCC 62051]|nr:hypothetical protein K438DRAFT_1962190 [Mycena galopus ATCC 62051]